MTHTMNHKLYERRKDMLKMRMQGTPWHNVVLQLQQDYSPISEYAINEDWRRRKQWMNLIVDIDNAEDYFKELFSGLELLKEKALFLVDNAHNEMAKIGAIRSAMDIYSRQIQILQSIGKLDSVDEPKEIRIRWENEPESVGSNDKVYASPESTENIEEQS